MKLSPKITRTIGRTVLKAKKNSPHIFFAVGVAGTIAGTALACRATVKLDKELDNIKHDLNGIKDLKKDLEEGKTVEGYSIEQYRQDSMMVYGRATGTIVRLYAPAAAVTIVSIGFLTGSHVQLTRRNQTLMALYTGAMTAYENYRQRVRDEVGVQRELDIYQGKTSQVIDVDEIGQDLDQITVKELTKGQYGSQYAKFFDDHNPNWTESPELNKMFIEAQQRWANQRLHFKGHVFLNEVYDLLGIDRTPEGNLVGWFLDEHGESEGDGYIRFGVYEPYNDRFVNGLERTCILDFNVDGIMFNKL